MNETTSARIERLLRERFAPAHFELHDDSEKHAGHPGATSGGGHYSLVIVSSTRVRSRKMITPRPNAKTKTGIENQSSVNRS